MKVLRTDQDYLDLAARNACSAACARAVRTGNYSPMLKRKLPWGNYGWSFAVWNERGSRWVILIELLESQRRYRVHSSKV